MDVNASGGQGVQAGSGNVQNNYFGNGEPRLDAASLGDFSPHTAAARIGRMRHDDAAILLARADVADAAKVLAVLLKADEPLTVALLADINRTKAETLIAAFAADVPWLTGLPEAAESIASRAVTLRWADGGLLERAAPSPQGREGYRRIYPDGQVYARPARPAFAVTGAIAEYFEAQGGTAVLGFPTTRESGVRSPQGTYGSSQGFGWAEVFTSAHGVFAVAGKIRRQYADCGDAGDWLGCPVSEERPMDPAAGRRWVQAFEGGSIFNDETGAITVRMAVLDCLRAAAPAHAWYPAADEADAEISPYGTTGRVQLFPLPKGSVPVYSSRTHGTWFVGLGMRELYAHLGKTGSWLGFPRGRYTRMETFSFQDFEGGAILSYPTKAAAVPAATMELLRRNRKLWDRLGFPLSAEEPVGTAEGDRCQFFENGVITVRDGHREIWVRP